MSTKNILLIGLLVFVTTLGWRISERLSADAIGMGIGMAFGIMAGVPVALLVMAAGQRRERQQRVEMERYNQLPAPYYQPPQPPVIIIEGLRRGELVDSQREMRGNRSID
jgi:hypothetical protein